MNKKASMELSVNFLVVMIICLLLLGVGIFLVTKGISVSERWNKDVDEGQKRQVLNLMSNGGLVFVVPTQVTIDRGDKYAFTLGISNELGKESQFSFTVAQENQLLRGTPVIYFIGDAVKVKNNDHHFWPIMIEMPKEAEKGTFIFNIYVCNDVNCKPSSAKRYGEMQQILINVR